MTQHNSEDAMRLHRQMGMSEIIEPKRLLSKKKKLGWLRSLIQATNKLCKTNRLKILLKQLQFICKLFVINDRKQMKKCNLLLYTNELIFKKNL